MGKANGQFLFTHPEGAGIYLFTLRNTKGTEVRITNYGGTITGFAVVQNNGLVNDIVLGFDDVRRYMDDNYLQANPYIGAAIGRYGNRIKNGRFNLDGNLYELTKNHGTEHLHGGRTGFDKVVWSVVSAGDNMLTLSYTSRDGEEGYPGNLTTTLRFELSDQNELSHEYTAVTDKPTPVNLTHHSYFNLNNGEGTIHDHFVRINASEVLAQDEKLTVTGKLINVEKTVYNFRSAKKISYDWVQDTGYDQSFVLDNAGENPAAEAYSIQSGLKLEVYTSEPVVHFYTGISLPAMTGKRGLVFGPFSGFCLETQVHPNAVNIPAFPDTILRPGMTYRHKTIYKVSAL
jgi:aldose 1-epimerase